LIMGFEKVLVTLGSQWVELWTWPDLQKYQANHVANVVDPTGAGDALRGWLLAWLAQGMNRSDAINQWQKLASLCIQKKGTIERSL
jgi:sugar/nucleoside kinase (ribokinase family)